MDYSYLSAINRKYPSPAARALVKHSEEGETILDYGCGYGNDAKYYERRKRICFNYDPYYFPELPTKKFDIVICSYVVNVVPSLREKIEVIRKAWSFTKETLIVSICPATGRKERITQRHFDFIPQIKARALCEVAIARESKAIGVDKFIFKRSSPEIEILSRVETEQKIRAIEQSGWVAPDNSYFRKQIRDGKCSYSINNDYRVLPGEKGLVKKVRLGDSLDSNRAKWAIEGVKRKVEIKRAKLHCEDFSYLHEFQKYPVLRVTKLR